MRKYVVINTSDVPNIDFSKVEETSQYTLRFSADDLKTFVKFDLPTPSSVTNLTTKSQEYTYDEILQILATPEWTSPMSSSLA